MAGCDVVFHAAGYAPQAERRIDRVVRVAVHEMRCVLDAARDAGIRRVIYTSSLTTIAPPGDPGRFADERDCYLPGSVNSSYYEAKWQMEHEALRATLEGLPVMILCPTAVFGPGDVKPSTSRLLLMLARRQLPVRVDVDVNIVDGRDVALAHLRAAMQGMPGERYIIGGHNLNAAEAIARAAMLMSVPVPRPVLGLAAMRSLIALTDLLRLPVPETMRTMPHWQPLNVTKGWQTFDLQPRPFDDTVRDTHAWFKANGYL
jgi:dihydroflavonol-4-reductase